MKTYMNPMLQVVYINTKDIITTSDVNANLLNTGTSTQLAPGQRGLDFESWYEGY